MYLCEAEELHISYMHWFNVEYGEQLRKKKKKKKKNFLHNEHLQYLVTRSFFLISVFTQNKSESLDKDEGNLVRTS